MENWTIAIINYNTRDLLRACLESVRPVGAAEVIVVDNASSDGGASMVERDFPAISLVANEANAGYGAAGNQAFAVSSGTYFLLLNSDTLLAESALPAMDRYLAAHPRVGVLGPRLVNPDGTLQPSCYPFPGSVRWMLDNDDLAPLVRRIPIVRERCFRTWSHDHSRRVPWVMGAALAFRRVAFEEVGGFDEDFFMYHEESDLCLRMARAGWETHFAPVTDVVHVGGASTSQHRQAMSTALYRSAQRFHRKHYRGVRLAVITALWRGLAVARCARLRVRRRLNRDPTEGLRLQAELETCREILRRA